MRETNRWSREFRFECPRCQLETFVDEAVRADMLSAGCYLCGAAVRGEHFQETGRD